MTDIPEDIRSAIEYCRAAAVECGKRASEFIAIRQYSKAGKELVAARKLTLRALELEQFPAPSTLKATDS